MTIWNALGVKPDMNDRDTRAAVAFGWYFYYGLTAQGRAHR
jgi:hypothetical protein